MNTAEVVVAIKERIGENGVFLFWPGREEGPTALLEGEHEEIFNDIVDVLSIIRRQGTAVFSLKALRIMTKISAQHRRGYPGEVLNPFVGQITMEIEVVYPHFRQSLPAIALIDKAPDIRFPVREK